MSRRTCVAILVAVFSASRLAWYLLGIRFDPEPLQFYWQFIDPALLRHDFWRSLFYLEHQPPVYNFYLGAVLHLFPEHPEIAYHITYLLLGLALATSLFVLMDRMQVDRHIALAIAIVFTLSPSTALYENLLFYEYPLTTLLCIAALFLHRYAAGGRVLDGFAFFCSLGLIAGIRSVYHLVWFIAIAAFVSFMLRPWRRGTVLVAAIPALLLIAFYTKHIVLFHNFMPGKGAFQGINLAAMTVYPLDPEALEPMIASGKISPILKVDLFELTGDFETDVATSSLTKIVPIPAPSGIPILDDCKKSTRAFNWNCAWMAEVAKVYSRDAMVVLRTHPEGYLQSVFENFLRYFLPDTEGWPWDGRTDDPNARILARPLAAYDLLTTGKGATASGRPWISYLALPCLLGFGLFRVIQGRRRLQDPSMIVLVFMICNIAYFTTAVLLLSPADQNRYRSELGAFFAVLLGLLLTGIWKRVAPEHRAPL